MEGAGTSTRSRRTSAPVGLGPIIDCDIHNKIPSQKVLASYLPAEWRRHLETFGIRSPSAVAFYPRFREFGSRADARPPSGVPPGADLDFLREQLLDRWDIALGVLNPIEQIMLAQQPVGFGAALARATNDHTLDEWLEREPRFVSSICVAQEDGDLASEEIRRLGEHPRFVQVLLTLRTRSPLGDRRYWPLYETAAGYDLPIAVHVGGYGGSTITGAGWPSFFYEDHVGYSQGFQEQLISLVCSGVFERFPDLRFILMEGGFAWLPSLMWRLDAAVRKLPDEMSHLREPPSHYIRRHVWVTTQPIEEPEKPAYFGQMLRALDMDDRILFASDYPHWDFDAPDQALPRTLTRELSERIYAGNARELYGLASSPDPDA